MSDTSIVQIKRGSSIPGAGILKFGELGYSYGDDGGRLYIGRSSTTDNPNPNPKPLTIGYNTIYDLLLSESEGKDWKGAPPNAIIRKLYNKENGFNQLYYTATKNGAFYATEENGSPKFGILPIAQGGTGRDLAADTTEHPYAILRLSSDATDYPYIYYEDTANGAFYATAEKGKPKFGILPIAQGGTGATSADDARNNLNVVNKSGDTMTGTLVAPQINIIHSTVNYPRMVLSCSDGINNGKGQYSVAASIGQIYMVEWANDSSTNYERYNLPAPATNLTENKTYSILTTKNTITVAQGGTGATTAAAAATNLKVLPLTGGTLSGSILINPTDPTSFRGLYTQRKITADSTDTYRAQFGVSVFSDNTKAGASIYLYKKADTDTDYTLYNQLILAEDYTGLRKPLNIASGGTGATSKVAARTNLSTCGVQYKNGLIPAANSSTSFTCEGYPLLVLVTISSNSTGTPNRTKVATEQWSYQELTLGKQKSITGSLTAGSSPWPTTMSFNTSTKAITITRNGDNSICYDLIIFYSDTKPI